MTGDGLARSSVCPSAGVKDLKGQRLGHAKAQGTNTNAEDARYLNSVTFHVSFTISLQMKGNVGQDDALFEQQRGLEHQRALVVQDTLPPTGGKNLRDDDRHPDVRFLFENLFDVVE